MTRWGIKIGSVVDFEPPAPDFTPINLPPVPRLTPDQEVAVGEAFHILALTSSDDHLAVDELEFSWEITAQPSGSVVTLDDGDTAAAGGTFQDAYLTPTHAGDYFVRVGVDDGVNPIVWHSGRVYTAVTVGTVLFAGHVPGRVLLGMATPSTTPRPGWDEARALIGQPIYEARRFSSGWYSSSEFDSLVGEGDEANALPWITFKVPGNDWAGVAAGDYDSDLLAIYNKAVARRTSGAGGTPQPFLISFHHEPSGDGVLSEWAAMQTYCAWYFGGRRGGTAASTYNAAHDVTDIMAWAPIGNGFWWNNNTNSTNLANREAAFNAAHIAALVANRGVFGADDYDPPYDNPSGALTNEALRTVPTSGVRASVKFANRIAWARTKGLLALGTGEFGCIDGAEITRYWDIASANHDIVAVLNYFNSFANATEERRLLPSDYPAHNDPNGNGLVDFGGNAQSQGRYDAFIAALTQSAAAPPTTLLGDADTPGTDPAWRFEDEVLWVMTFDAPGSNPLTQNHPGLQTASRDRATFIGTPPATMRVGGAKALRIDFPSQAQDSVANNGLTGFGMTKRTAFIPAGLDEVTFGDRINLSYRVHVPTSFMSGYAADRYLLGIKFPCLGGGPTNPSDPFAANDTALGTSHWLAMPMPHGDDTHLTSRLGLRMWVYMYLFWGMGKHAQFPNEQQDQPMRVGATAHGDWSDASKPILRLGYGQSHLIEHQYVMNTEAATSSPGGNPANATAKDGTYQCRVNGVIGMTITDICYLRDADHRCNIVALQAFSGGPFSFDKAETLWFDEPMLSTDWRT